MSLKLVFWIEIVMCSYHTVEGGKYKFSHGIFSKHHCPCHSWNICCLLIDLLESFVLDAY